MDNNLIKLIEKSIQENWDLKALTNYKGSTLQYKDVARRIEKIHIVFAEAGIKKGDANNDDKINVTDIAMIASHIKGIKALSNYQFNAADVNNDKKLTVTDIAMIAAHIKGIKAIG